MNSRAYLVNSGCLENHCAYREVVGVEYKRWSRRLDLNQHSLAGTRLSTWRVCQFPHDEFGSQGRDRTYANPVNSRGLYR